MDDAGPYTVFRLVPERWGCSFPLQGGNLKKKLFNLSLSAPFVFGIFVEGRIVLLYTYETDLGDGWEDAEVHNNPQSVREKALKMGANILNYAFKN